jgi:hypothetical protein
MAAQKTITISDLADAEFTAIAAWKGLPVARLLSQYIEVIHQSDEFCRLLERAQRSQFTLTGEENAQKEPQMDEE